MGMTDISEKPIIKRRAEAAGTIFLSQNTLREISNGKTVKGDPLVVAELGAMNAAKQTYLLIPHCHQISIDSIHVTFQIMKSSVEARCIVSAQSRTGVEMEALVGVSAALNTVWDMVKYLEKDEMGQYPTTRITDIRIISKKKGE